MAVTDEELFARSFLLAPLHLRDEAARRNAKTRQCLTCDQPVFIDNPLQVRSATRPDGHDSNCRALEIFYNGFNGVGGGGINLTLARTDIFLSNAAVTLGTLSD